jgi:hypothetical protein
MSTTLRDAHERARGVNIYFDSEGVAWHKQKVPVVVKLLFSDSYEFDLGARYAFTFLPLRILKRAKLVRDQRP